MFPIKTSSVSSRVHLVTANLGFNPSWVIPKTVLMEAVAPPPPAWLSGLGLEMQCNCNSDMQSLETKEVEPVKLQKKKSYVKKKKEKKS